MAEEEEQVDATAPSNGIGGGESIPPPDPSARATATTSGGETTQATVPEAAATEDDRALHDYAQRYSGRTLLARLLHIARSCRVEGMELEALRIAMVEVKKGKNMLSYGDVYEKINGRFGDSYDQGWLDSIYRSFSHEKELIEREITFSKDNQNTAGVMIGYVNLGDHYYDYGYLPDALKCYNQMEDYFTTPQDLVLMCMKSILVNLELQKYDRVLNHVNMLKTCLHLLSGIDIAKLHVVTGLAYLGRKDYKLAALEFLETGPEIGRNYTEVIAPEDVGLYGAICALATLDCSAMKVKVMDNVNFGLFLQLVPQIRELVHEFYHSHHTSCLKLLESIKPHLLLDIHLADHVDTLLLVISQKSGYVALDDLQLDELLQLTNFDQNEVEQHESPLNDRVEEEPTHEENQAQIVVVANLVLPDAFNDETPLLVSPEYKFVNVKELMVSLGKRNIGWISRHNAHAILINARLFARDSARDDDERVDGRMVVVSDAKFSIFEVQYSSYTITAKPLKETRLVDKENSALDRFQMKGNIWTRRRICLKGDHSYHLIQWRQTPLLRRAQVQPTEPAAQNTNNVRPLEAAATQNVNNVQLNETMKSLIEHLKEHTSALAETRQSVVELNCSLAEARKTAATTAMGPGVAN